MLAVFNVIAFFLLGSFIGKFMAFTSKYLPKILLDEIGEPDDVWKWFFQKPHCRSCRHPRTLPESLPILGYVIQKGKCRYCRKPIGSKGVFLEIAMALIFGLSVLFFPLTLHMIFVFFMTTFLILCFITDFEHGILPDQFTQPMVWAGLIVSLIPLFIPPAEAIIGAAGGYGIFWIFNVAFRSYRGVDGMYPGDFKLNAAIGAGLGFKWVLVILVISFFLLILVTATQFFFGKKQNDKSFLRQEAPWGCYSSLVAIVILYILLIQATT
jgi:leader peptidase (prepilin peptidase) / N-methyltransferase